MKINPYSTISIMGLGLMGSSLAAAVRKFFPASKILGISSKTTYAKALELKLIDKGFHYEACQEALETSDLILLCTPIDNIIDHLRAWASAPPEFKKGCLITDIGSTKVEICRAAEAINRNTQAVFLGSHPMAGSEKTGIDACDPLIYENAPWIVCPLGKVSPADFRRFRQFVESLGCLYYQLDPELHDEVVAQVSHLPQILSSGLAGYLAGRPPVLENGLRISGGGLRDMTRLANSSFSIWQPIFSSNHGKILQTLLDFGEYWRKLTENFKNSTLEDDFKLGSGLKQKLLKHNKMMHSQLAEILVDLPDETGILVKVLSHLVDINLNILDIEILKVREGESGTLRIGFKNKSEADSALARLLNHNYVARPR